MSIEATVSTTDIKRILTKLNRINPTYRAGVLYNSFRRVGLMVERALKENISGKILKVQTGRLRSSIGSRVEITSDGIEAVIGSGVRTGKRVVYADIHETGGMTGYNHAVNIPARRYMSRTLAEVQGKITALIMSDIQKGLSL